MFYKSIIIRRCLHLSSYVHSYTKQQPIIYNHGDICDIMETMVNHLMNFYINNTKYTPFGFLLVSLSSDCPPGVHIAIAEVIDGTATYR